MSFWDVGVDGLNQVERRHFREMRSTREVLQSGQIEAAEQNRQILEEIGKCGKQLEKLTAATENGAQTIVAELQRGSAEIVSAIENLGDKIDDLADRIDQRLVELIEAIHTGFAELTSQLRTVNAQLSRLIEILESPAEIRAVEQMKAGLLAFHNSLWLEARQRFEAATEYFDLIPVPWLYLGKIAFYVDGNLSEADDFFAKAVRYGKLRPRDAILAAHGLIHRAYVAFINKDKTSCIAFANEAIKLAPTSINVLVPASKCMLVSGRPVEAARILCHAFDVFPPTVVELTFEWTDPIKDNCAEWLSKQHGIEIVPIQSVQKELEDIQKNAETKGFFFGEWTSFDAQTRIYDQMSRGFADLRLNSWDYLQSTKSLSEDVKLAMQNEISKKGALLSNYKKLLLNRWEQFVLIFAFSAFFVSFTLFPFLYPEIIMSLGLIGIIIKWASILFACLTFLILVGATYGESDIAKIAFGIMMFFGIIFIKSKQYDMFGIVASIAPIVLLLIALLALARKEYASTERKNIKGQLAHAKNVLKPLIARLRELAERTIPSLMKSVRDEKARGTLRASIPSTPLAKMLNTAKRGVLFWLGKSGQIKSKFNPRTLP